MSDMKERFAKIVKTTTGQDLNPRDIMIKNLRENDNPDFKRNTRCFLMAMANGSLRSGMNFYYNRLDLGKVFRDTVPILEMEYGSRVTTRDIAALVADRYGLDLYPEDVQPSGEFYLSTLPYDVQLFAEPGSLCVVGRVIVRLVDAGAKLSTVMGVTNLNGINPPNGNLDNKIQGATLSWQWKTLPQIEEILDATALDTQVPDTMLPYLTQLSQDQLENVEWVMSDEPAEFNLKGAKLVYSGLRDNHPHYAAAGSRDYLYVISLSDDSTRIGGELLFTATR